MRHRVNNQGRRWNWVLTGVLLLQEKGGNKAGTERPKPRVKEQAAANDSAGSEDSEDDVSDEDVSGSEVRSTNIDVHFRPQIPVGFGSV